MADQGLIGGTSVENAHDWAAPYANQTWGEGARTSAENSNDFFCPNANLWVNQLAQGVAGAALNSGETNNNWNRPAPWYRAVDKNGTELFVAQSSTITGTVRENGAVLAGCVVMLFYRPTGACIGRTWTATDGTFSFTGLYADNNYYVVYQDKAGGYTYNDIVWSLVTPG